MVRSAYVLSGVLAILWFGCGWSAQAGGSPPPKRKRVALTVKVSGDVQAALSDARGRKTGWYDGRLADIPGCRLAAIEDEVAEPQDYTFHFSGVHDGSFRLLMKPRTQGQVSIEVDGKLSSGSPCIAHADTELVKGETQLRIRWGFARDSCHVSITPIMQNKGTKQ